jgi:dipeptidyl aminopeptidase/acylaminoacyl peptidase
MLTVFPAGSTKVVDFGANIEEISFMARSSRALVVLALAAAAPAALWPARPARAAFTVEQVTGAPFPSQLVAARQGERIAWVMDRRGERNVWVADGPAFEPRQVTHYQGDDGQQIASLRLTPDGQTAVYARGSEVNEAGDSANPLSRAQTPKQQVWAVGIPPAGAGGAAAAATAAKAAPRLLGDMGCAEEGCEDVQISPDGRSAVWAAKHFLWLAPVGGGAPARQLHALHGTSSETRWSPDGKRIAFRLDRGDHSFVVVYDLSTQGLLYMSPSVDRDQLPRWSRDGSRLAFIREPARAEKLPLIPERPRPWSLWVGDPATGEAHEVWHSIDGPEGSLSPFAAGSLLFAAGDRIVFASEQDGRNHLYSLAAGAHPAAGAAAAGFPGGAGPAGATAVALLLTPGDYDVEDVELSADGASVLFSANEHRADPADEDRRHLWRVGAAGGAPPQALSAGEGIEWSPVETGDGKVVVCLGSSATTPAMPYRLASPPPPASAAPASALATPPSAAAAASSPPAAAPPAGGTAARLPLAAGLLPADFPAAELVTPRQVVFRSADGLAIHGQLFMPRGAPAAGGSLPALIFTHGGPVRQMLLGFHYMYYYHNAYAMNQYLASRGYVVLSVNYRLGIMYGRAFREAPHGAWRGSAEYADVVAGAHFLQGLPQVDPHRIGLWGGSYGGLLTALGLARDSALFAAGVDFHGVHDWSMLLPRWEEGSPAAAPDAREAYRLAFESSPDAAVESWRSPVLLIHGDDDRNVPFAQTRDLVQRLRGRRVPVEELIFPDEIHDLLLWKDWVRSYQAAADFFDRRLRAAPAAPPG